jgi:hypothetical protein
MFLDKNNNLSNTAIKFKHDNTPKPKEAKQNTLSLFYLREHGNRHEFSLGSFSIFNMMQDVLFVLTRQSSRISELAPVAWHIHVSPYNN